MVDVRHEQTAVFAAEATAKLTRGPGLAVLTAGPGVTNGVSARDHRARSTGRRCSSSAAARRQGRWGTGSLQELDHPPLLAPVTKHAATVRAAGDVAARSTRRCALAALPHRGPVFLDVPMDQLFSAAEVPRPPAARAARARARPRRPRPRRRPAARGPAPGARARLRRVARRRGGRRPAARGAARPARRSRTGRGAASCPRATRCWSPAPARAAFGRADLVWSSAPRWTSGSATAPSAAGRRRRPPGRPPRRLARAGSPRTSSSPAGAAGDLTLLLDGVTAAAQAGRRLPSYRPWLERAAGRGARRRRPPTARLLTQRRRPDPPGPRLRRAAAACSTTTRSSSATAATSCPSPASTSSRAAPGCWLDPGALRLPRHRPRLRDRRPAGPPVEPGRAAARRRRRRVLADGRRHAGAPPPAGRDGGRQQLRLGPGEAPDAVPLRLRRRGRPRPADAVRRGGAGARRRRRARHRPRRHRLRRSPAPSPPTCPTCVNVATDPEVAYPRATTGV